MFTEFALLLFLMSALTLVVHRTEGAPCQRRVCYLYLVNTSSQAERFLPNMTDTSLCTHIIYKGVQHDARQGIQLLIKDSDLTKNSRIGNFQRVLNLKASNRRLKVLLSIDFNQCGDERILHMATSSNITNDYLGRAYEILRNYTFDGLEFHCNYLDYEKNNTQLKNALTRVMGIMRTALDTITRPKKLLLTLTAQGDQIYKDDVYDIHNLTRIVDWVNIVSWDLKNFTGAKAYHNRPLNRSSSGEGYRTMVEAYKHWKNRGAPVNKLVFVVTGNAVAFNLTTSQTDVGAPVMDYPRIPNKPDVVLTLAYYQFCHIINENTTTLHYIKEEKVPYLVQGRLWYAYENATSLKEKARFIKRNNLGGIAFLALNSDDFQGTFCGKGKYPLLKAINRTCNSNN